MNELFDKLVEQYFEPQIELLPDGALESIKAGKKLEIVSVKGANQLDIGTITELLAAVLTLISAVLQILPKKSKAELKSETRTIIERNYPIVARSLDRQELDSFINDLVDGL